jgi:transcriptional regulator with XRE-family HTH domain
MTIQIRQNPRKHSFGQKLYELRKKRGLTQSELAAKMDTTLRGVSYYEREVENPSMELIERAAKALGVQKKYFIEDNVKIKVEETPPVIKSLKATIPKLSSLPRREQESLAMVINSFIEKNKK